LQFLKKHFEQWESDPKRMENGNQYESSYVSMMEKVEQEVLQLSVGTAPKDKNLKKTPDPIWKDSPLQEPYHVTNPGLYGH